MPECTPDEFLAILCARQVGAGDRVGVGVSSPIATAGAMLASLLHAPQARYSVPGMGESYFRGSHEVSGFAQCGKMDLFFLSAVQIDAEANINLQYIGDADHPKKRFLGAFAAPVYYYVMGRTVLVRNQHTPRVFVPRVDFVTAAGPDTPGHRRIGWPSRVITPLAVLDFNRQTGLLELGSHHPGVSVADVREATGFELPVAASVHETPAPSADEIELMTGPVRSRMQQLFHAWG